MNICANLLIKSAEKAVKLTAGFRYYSILGQGQLSDMEGIITTATGEKIVAESTGPKRASASPVGPSPSKKIFLGISPLKDLDIIKTPTERPFRVSIEGNIGAGKSTLIKYFQNIEGLETYPEPIEWWRNLNGENLLDLMYSDIYKWLNVFQSYVQLSRLQIQTSKPKSTNTKVQMFERSIQNNRFCFMEQAYRNGYLHGADYSILDQWYRWVRGNIDINLDLIVYLRSTPETVHKRMLARGRPEESQVSLEYLQQLHESHERWLMTDDERFNTVPVVVIDADKTLDEIIEDYKRNENKILGFEKNGYKKIEKESKDRVKKVLQMEEF